MTNDLTNQAHQSMPSLSRNEDVRSSSSCPPTSCTRRRATRSRRPHIVSSGFLLPPRSQSVLYRACSPSKLAFLPARSSNPTSSRNSDGDTDFRRPPGLRIAIASTQSSRRATLRMHLLARPTDAEHLPSKCRHRRRHGVRQTGSDQRSFPLVSVAVLEARGAPAKFECEDARGRRCVGARPIPTRAYPGPVDHVRLR